jgi:hypothetical protein
MTVSSADADPRQRSNMIERWVILKRARPWLATDLKTSNGWTSNFLTFDTLFDTYASICEVMGTL